MDLQTQLDRLAEQVASFHESPHVSDAEWQNFADNTVVALMAGGESTRYAAVLAGEKIQKNAHQLPNGDTMIEMCIRAYRDAGIKRFVALVYHNAHTVQDRLGDGSSMGVQITYCQDPEPPAGTGGAVRNALDAGFIPGDCTLIVANPDDVIMEFPGSYVRFIGESHLEGVATGHQVTAVVARGQKYASTGLMVVDNEVVNTQMYPMIPVPAHVGISVFSPETLPRFTEHFPLDQKNAIEQVLFPVLAAENKLWSAGLHQGTWIAVNDLKSYKQLVELLPETKPQ